MKATLNRLCDLGWETLTKLKALLKQNNAPVTNEVLASPSLRIGMAKNDMGKEIAYCVVENVLLVRTSLVNPDPTLTLNEISRAGDYVDQQIANHAQRLGISQVLVACPPDFHDFDSECITLKFLVRQVPAPIATTGAVGDSHDTHHRFLN